MNKFRTMETQNLLSDDTEIYKYISHKYIENLFNEHYLHFQEITKWPDMMELFLDKIVNPNTQKQRYGSCWTLHKGIERIVDTMSRLGALEEIRRNGVESMWVTYCPNGGIRIKTTLGKIRKCVNDFCTNHNSDYQEGLVVYESYQATTRNRVNELCFSKQPNFYSDDEYRFVVTTKNSDGDSLRIEINDIANFVDEVLISPIKRNSSAKRDEGESDENSNKINEIFSGLYFFSPGNNEKKSLVVRKSVLYGRW